MLYLSFPLLVLACISFSVYTGVFHTEQETELQQLIEAAPGRPGFDAETMHTHTPDRTAPFTWVS